MKANLRNLKKALRACANAHGVEFKWWRNDGQITLKSQDIPVLSDVRMIVEAFYGRQNVDGIVESGYGYTTVWIYAGMDSNGEVDEQLLSLALPYGTEI